MSIIQVKVSKEVKIALQTVKYNYSFKITQNV